MPQPIESPYYTHSQHPVSNAVGTVVSATTYHQQFTPFHTTSSYRSKQVVSAASSAKQYMTTATMMTNDGWEVLSPCAVPMTSVSSMTPVVSSSLSASEESAGGSAMACVSPFRSTSAYMSGMQGNGLLAMATPMQTAGFGAIAQTAAAAYAAQSPLFAATTAPARSIDLANIINFYTTAEELMAEKLSWGEAQITTYGRPDDGPSIGELTPVGDAVLPLVACVIAYAACKIRRKITLKKASAL